MSGPGLRIPFFLQNGSGWKNSRWIIVRLWVTVLISVVYAHQPNLIWREVWMQEFGRSLLEINIDSLALTDLSGNLIGYYYYDLIIQGDSNWFRSDLNPARMEFYPLVTGDRKLYREISITNDGVQDTVDFIAETGSPVLYPNEKYYIRW